MAATRFERIFLNIDVEHAVNISVENRQRISLAFFFIFDHFMWYWGGYLVSVTLPYVIASEGVRIVAFCGIVGSFYKKKHIESAVFIISIYCFIMIPFSFFAGRSYDRTGKIVLENFFWIKKDPAIPVEYGMVCFFIYMYMLYMMYFYAWKHLEITQNK